MITVCKNCKNKYKHSPSRNGIFCSRKCYVDGTDIIRRMVNARKGKPNWRKGKSRFKNEDEKRLSSLANGRKSYRKNIEKRLFYYRQLAFKRRNMGGSFSQEQWNDIIQKQSGLCNICKISCKLTIDHIIPISKWEEYKMIFNLLYECNDIQNIQGLCKSCNCKKSNIIS